MDDTINAQLMELPGLGININILIFRTGFTQVDQVFIRSDDYDRNWRDETFIGFIICGTLIFGVMGATVLTNLYFLWQHQSKSLRDKFSSKDLALHEVPEFTEKHRQRLESKLRASGDRSSTLGSAKNRMGIQSILSRATERASEQTVGSDMSALLTKLAD